MSLSSQPFLSGLEIFYNSVVDVHSHETKHIYP